jgi:rhodanese-related sulfurtransferase
MSYEGDLTPQEAWDMLASNPKAVLVDVRTKEEWSAVGVPDTSPLGRPAVFVQWSTYPDDEPNPMFIDELRTAGLEPGIPLLIICRSGHRSIAAAIEATEAGFGPCYNVLEGFEGAADDDGRRSWQGWKVLGLPWRQ